MNRKKIRLDSYLAEKGLSRSREQAKKEIIAGWVKVEGETVHEPSRTIDPEAAVTVDRPGGLFVSRGGEKLSRALEEFRIDVTGRIAADLGASTGGFTHCLLMSGARRVYAIDVGYGQLDYSLRGDERVRVMERTNVKNLTPADFDDTIDFFSADLSFISILKVIPVIQELFGAVEGVILVKPQFEAEPGEHKKGVVRRDDIHARILMRVLDALRRQGVFIRGLCHSPIKGPAGNIEFLLHVTALSGASTDTFRETQLEELVAGVVRRAHEDLNSAS